VDTRRQRPTSCYVARAGQRRTSSARLRLSARDEGRSLGDRL
jgi:hypothetical protein